MRNYWEITEYDGTVTLIPPDSVEYVRKQRTANLPIKTTTRDITPNQVKKFVVTDKPFSNQKLLEEVAQVFGDPIYDDAKTNYGYIDQVLRCRWVKKEVTNDRWNRYYSSIPGYKFLEETNGFTTIAFMLPVHIKNDNVGDCSVDDINKLIKHK